MAKIRDEMLRRLEQKQKMDPKQDLRLKQITGLQIKLENKYNTAGDELESMTSLLKVTMYHDDSQTVKEFELKSSDKGDEVDNILQAIESVLELARRD